jgi:hypothetical protein
MDSLSAEHRFNHLTMEALILSLDYREQLFTPKATATAEERLKAARAP